MTDFARLIKTLATAFRNATDATTTAIKHDLGAAGATSKPPGSSAAQG